MLDRCTSSDGVLLMSLPIMVTFDIDRIDWVALLNDFSQIHGV